MRLRYTPELSLALDQSLEYSAHIQKLLLDVEKDKAGKDGNET